MSTSGAGPIAVGVADTQHAALAFAAEEARLQGCALQVVHAYIVPPSPPEAFSAAYGVDIEGSFRESGREVLDGAVGFLAAQHGDITVEALLERGPASRVLIDASALARLLVLGPDDAMPWYSRLFRSRVSRDLTGESQCPVVVVPDTWLANAPAGGVTVLLDHRSTAVGPLRFALEHASRHHDAVHIVHVQDDGSTDETVRELRELVDSCSDRFSDVQVSTSAIHGVPDESAPASLQKTGLLVLGRPHEHRLPGLPDRSLARTVIEHAGCPAAVVPADYGD